MTARAAVFTPAEQTAVDAYVAELVAAAPPLSDQQRDRLTILFRRPKTRAAA